MCHGSSVLPSGSVLVVADPQRPDRAAPARPEGLRHVRCSTNSSSSRHNHHHSAAPRCPFQTHQSRFPCSPPCPQAPPPCVPRLAWTQGLGARPVAPQACASTICHTSAGPRMAPAPTSPVCGARAPSSRASMQVRVEVPTRPRDLVVFDGPRSDNISLAFMLSHNSMSVLQRVWFTITSGAQGHLQWTNELAVCVCVFRFKVRAKPVPRGKAM